MAEAFARIHGANRVEAVSAGSRPSGRINPLAVKAMREVGYDLSRHQSKSLEEIPAGADDEQGQRRLRRRPAHELQTGKVAEVLRWRGEGRPHAEIASAVKHGLPHLFDVVRAHADEQVRADDAPRLLHGQVVLAEVDA